MQNIDVAERFIKNKIKYSADRCYVADVSPSLISGLWRRINENEFNGFGHEIRCGHIDINILRAAFLREMSYNPMRFDRVSLDSPGRYDTVTTDIVSEVRRALAFFAKVWPNGIQNEIVILDTTKSEYRFLVAMRDCFKKIARQNLADFNRAAYRDEMIARFANATDILIPADIRTVLQKKATASAPKRDSRRNARASATAKKQAADELAQRIHNIQMQMALHARHDAEYYKELQTEYDDLLMEWNALTAVHSQALPQKRPAKPVSAVAPSPQPYVAMEYFAGNEGGSDVSDSAERENELLRTLTPEHMSDEIFQDYVKKMVGLNPWAFNQKQH